MFQGFQGGSVRHSIDQGLVRAELATNADKDFLRVYKGNTVTGTVAATKVSNAIDNYKAAVACFVRALPSFEDANSSALVREEIRRMLARMGELEQIQREIDPENAPPAPTEAQDRFLQDLKFKIGDLVQVDNAKLGKIQALDYETGTYTIAYENGTLEHGVVEPRIAPASIANNNNNEQEEAERIRLWSEIIEAERIYCSALKTDMVLHYLRAFDSPMHWIGQKSAADTVFTQKTITEAERHTLFGNIEELAGTSEVILQALEAKFAQYEKDPQLAQVFLDCSALLLEPYSVYAEAYYSSQDLLAKIKRERTSFEAIEMRAQREFGSATLETLMRLPLEYPKQMQSLLLSLYHRTPSTHVEYDAIRRAYALFSQVEEGINMSLNRVNLEKVCKQVEREFNPPIGIAQRGRFLVLKQDNIACMDSGKRVMRAVWLFNNLVIVGRKSEWFAVGQYRVVRHFAPVMARSAPEYGPFAVEICGSVDKDRCLLVLGNMEQKQEWMHALRGFIKQAAAPPIVETGGRTQLGQVTKQVLVRRNSSRTPPPPPPPPPPPKTWVKARAKFTFDQARLPDDTYLAFNKGDELEIVPIAGTTGGWAKGRLRGKMGNVPLNFLEIL